MATVEQKLEGFEKLPELRQVQPAEQPLIHAFEILEFMPKAKKAPLSARHLNSFPKPENIERFNVGQHNQALEKARQEILNNTQTNEKLNRLMIKAIQAKEGMNVVWFSQIENLFIKNCVNLTDGEIDSLVRQFNEKFRRWYNEHRGTIEVTGKTMQEIQTGHWDILPNGIRSVVHFLRARRRLLESQPKQNYEFLFDDALDARWKADVVEVIFREDDGNLIIDELNLIQIKSSQPTREEKSSITSSHRNFFSGGILSPEQLENVFLGETDRVQIKGVERFLKTEEAVKEALLDIITEPSLTDDLDLIFKKLQMN